MFQIKKRELVFAVFCLLFIFALFLRSCTAVIVGDLMKAFSIPAASLGLMASAFFYAYAAVQIPVGLLSDRIGVRYTVFCFGLLGVAGSTFFAYSTNINMATWARLLTGVGTAGIWIPALKYLATAYRPDEFAILTSVINAIGGLGLTLAALPMTLMVEKIGWRQACFLPGMVLLLLVILAWHLMKPQPHNQVNIKDNNDGGSGDGDGGGGGGAGDDGGKKELGKETKEKEWGGIEKKEGNEGGLKPKTPPHGAATAFYRHPPFWLFALWSLLVYGIYLSFMTLWGAAYLQDSFNLSRETAGGHLMFISLGMIVGGLAWGVLSDRVFRARRPVLFLGTLGLLLTWATIFYLPGYPGPFYTSLLYSAIGFFSVVFLINMGCVKELFPASVAGTAMGTVNAFMFVGVALFQGVSGYMLDYFRETRGALGAFRSFIILYLIGIALALLLVIFMPETFPGKQKNQSIPENVKQS